MIRQHCNEEVKGGVVTGSGITRFEYEDSVIPAVPLQRLVLNKRDLRHTLGWGQVDR
jgi:hypothetical protein